MTAETSTATSEAPTTHEGILAFVNEVAELTTPDRVYWCTGSDEEWVELTDALVATGTFRWSIRRRHAAGWSNAIR